MPLPPRRTADGVLLYRDPDGPLPGPLRDCALADSNRSRFRKLAAKPGISGKRLSGNVRVAGLAEVRLAILPDGRLAVVVCGRTGERGSTRWRCAVEEVLPERGYHPRHLSSLTPFSHAEGAKVLSRLIRGLAADDLLAMLDNQDRV